MGSSDIDPQINDEAESRDDLLSLDAEVKERLEDYYAEITLVLPVKYGIVFTMMS
jgi:hypothetical protein